MGNEEQSDRSEPECAPTVPFVAPTGVPAPTPEPQEVPTQIGNYTIERELGRGGMGVVYLAEDPRLKRRVALKVLPDKVATDARALEAFEREARLLAALQHTNIATIFSWETERGLRFFTMEFVEGTNLAARLLDRPLELKESLGIARQISRALQAAHRRGVVHRDLKPANIALTDDEQVKVLDFGIAAARSERARQLAVSETTGAYSGTPGYMSPEQFEGTTSDERVDIWAFGCVVFECLSGRQALGRPTYEECVQATQKGEVDWTLLPVKTPPRVVELLKKCLTPDLDERLPSIGEARRILEEVLSLTDSDKTIQLDSWAAITPNNLPAQPSSFVGREALLKKVVDRVSETPLVTLTGTGGSGKTRLALEVAQLLLPRFRDGVHLVELAAITEPDRVVRAVAVALGVQEEAGRDLVESLSAHLGSRSLLILLDNCEQIVEGVAGLLERLLRDCPAVHWMASSRELLGVSGEAIQMVPPLELPTRGPAGSLEALARSESVALFLDRARAVQPLLELTSENADSVAEICRRLDGIPLALELAAARVRVLSLPELRARLADRFKLLRGGSRNALPRQKTLEATIAWSYDHLDSDEQLLMRRFAAFVGGWSLEAAEVVCASDPLEDWQVLDLLSSLVDRSLVEANVARTSGGEGMRYRLLESIREYAWLRSDELGETAEQRSRHRRYYLELAERAHRDLRGPKQGYWFGVLESEYDNLRAAMQGCLQHDEELALGLEMANSLAMFWIVRGYWHDGRRTFEALLAHPDLQASDATRARALSWAGSLAACQGDFPAAASRAEQGLAMQEQLGDKNGVAGALNDLAIVERRRGDPAAARKLFERSLELRRELEDSKGVAVALSNLGLVSLEQQDLDAAAEFYDESLSRLRGLEDPQGIAVCLNSLGSIEFHRGNFEEASACYNEALTLSRSMGNRRTERNILHNLGLVAKEQGDLQRAKECLGESLRARTEMGDQAGARETLAELIEVSLEAGENDSARAFLEQAWPDSTDLDSLPAVAPRLALATARLACSCGLHQEAAQLIGWAHERSKELKAVAPAAVARADWEDEARRLISSERWDALLLEGSRQPAALISSVLSRLADV